MHKAFSAGLPVVMAAFWDFLGEPPLRLHPVVWYGQLIRALERAAPEAPAAQLWYGLALPVLAAPLVLLPTLFINHAAKSLSTLIESRYPQIGKLVYSLLMGGALKPFFALRMLADAGRTVRLPLERNNLAEAREALQSLVSRERSELTEQLVAAAAVESLAENLSDSIVAPLFYFTLFGLPGAALYRLGNTFDSMLGYHGHYEYLGKVVARLDDLLNLVPARLTALLIILCAPFYHGDAHQAWRIWRRDAHKTASPNAGHPMAAAAGAFGVQLEKVNHYVLGDKSKSISPHDIQRAERMVWMVGGVTIILSAVCKILWAARND